MEPTLKRKRSELDAEAQAMYNAASPAGKAALTRLANNRKQKYKKKYKKQYRRSYGGGSGRGGNISVIQGRGDYSMNPGDTFGRRYGGYLGSLAGEYLGGMAHNAIGGITGLGDYSVEKNVFAGNRLPQITNLSGNGGTTIRFQEYLGDVVTSSVPGQFNLDSFTINPANENTFPWLAQIASNYDQYEIEGLLFEFRSTSGDALTSANTALGSVMMATQYDTEDAVFQTKSEMLNYEFSTSAKPSNSSVHMIECDPKQTTVSLLFTAPVAEPSNGDPRFNDLGRFSIATTGFQGASVNAGELHCTYQVRLLKPKLFVTLGNFNGLYHATMADWDTPTTIGTLTSVYDTLGMSQTSNVLNFPKFGNRMHYTVRVRWVNSITYTATVPSLSTVNCAFSDFEAVTLCPDGGVNALFSEFSFSLITQANTDAYVGFTAGPAAGVGVTTGDIYVTQIAAGPFVPL